MATTLGPALEELFFRGFLWAVLVPLLEGHASSRTSATLVVLASALIFAALHTNPSPVYVYLRFAAGTLHGFLRLRSNSALPPAAAHWMFNVFLVA
jgi:membrane protease YdiL (CAAX protease family)